MQHSDILGSEPWGLPLNETILPQVFRANGYATHIVGKWGLGFYQKEFTPTFRGFDTHYGMWLGHQDYFSHVVTENVTSCPILRTKVLTMVIFFQVSDEMGYDMRRNMEIDWNAKGKYTTTILTEEAANIINEHDESRPMFLYLSHLAPHRGNAERPLQAPDEIIAKFSHIDDPELRIYAGKYKKSSVNFFFGFFGGFLAMITVLDQNIGKIVTTLTRKRMLDNSVIVFLSDNGSPYQNFSDYRPNFPLRGVSTKNII